MIGMIISTMGSISDSMIGIIVIGDVGADVVGMIVVLVTLIMIVAAADQGPDCLPLFDEFHAGFCR
ncbi:hypothetical protein [Mesorhizobium sp.]|uniref:hypothetical protein n=1 Tax=Mesorhizobium sp. TaxID=1871066 RepID=UPI0012081F62|nr:hypothetical protein [Mesorhizobium sp.]TIS53919.1 MAG: hypothetical protein E5W91_28860 [Mesorhizobium sp.]TIS86008.1 MAG: hypothetical protein E5W89_30965 [Mesorhizobium sp.]